jgi:diaminopimelate epimerase
MTRVQFVKVSGAGNDFVLIDNLDGHLGIAWVEFSRAVCDRHRGVGADGLIVLQPTHLAAFEMMYFNADGSAGAMCGNGGRAAVYYFGLRYSARNSVEFTFGNDRYHAEVKRENVCLSMKNPSIIDANLRLEIAGRELRGYVVDSGAPHVVFPAEQVVRTPEQFDEMDIVSLCRSIRYHGRFAPYGKNVDLIIMRNNEVIMRTYERGVEAETLACGTGAVACAIVANASSGLCSPVHVHTRGGETVTVRFEITYRGYEHVVLEGAANIHFSGTLLFDETLKSAHRIAGAIQRR